MIVIKSWRTQKELFSADVETVKDALVAAVASEANMSGADLRWARLPTGETWEEHLAQTLPALLVAGGQPLESFAESWQRHSWENCPMHHAFGAADISGVPMLLRPRAEQFIYFFDHGLIPWPLPVPADA